MSKYFAQPLVAIALQPQYNLQSEMVSVSLKLINQSPFTVRYQCYFATDKRPEKFLENTILSGENLQLEGLRFSELNDNPTIAIQIEIDEEVVEKNIKIKAKTFFNKPPFLQVLQAEAFLYELWKENDWEKENNTIAHNEIKDKDEENIIEEPPLEIDAEQLKQALLGGNKKTSTKIIHQEAADKIDLHIEAINPKYEHLHPSEIVNIQMNVFERNLERAIAADKHSIIVIHGVGDGVLKKKIRAFCSTHPRVKKCSDPLVNNYGAGATEIYFK